MPSQPDTHGWLVGWLVSSAFTSLPFLAQPARLVQAFRCTCLFVHGWGEGLLKPCVSVSLFNSSYGRNLGAGRTLEVSLVMLVYAGLHFTSGYHWQADGGTHLEVSPFFKNKYF